MLVILQGEKNANKRTKKSESQLKMTVINPHKTPATAFANTQKML